MAPHNTGTYQARVEGLEHLRELDESLQDWVRSEEDREKDE